MKMILSAIVTLVAVGAFAATTPATPADSSATSGDHMAAPGDTATPGHTATKTTTEKTMTKTERHTKAAAVDCTKDDNKMNKECTKANTK